MPKAYKDKEYRPSDGGRLVTELSSDNVDLANYTKKKNIRRSFDKEVRSEGDAYFQPITERIVGTQASPTNGEPITLVHSMRAATGNTALVIGTPSRLLRFIGVASEDVYQSGHSIFVVDKPGKIFKVPSDVSGEFTDGTVFDIELSCGNNGEYTCDGNAAYDPLSDLTTITVDEVIPSTRADGVAVFPVYALEITEASTGSKHFKVADDHTAVFLDGVAFRVVGAEDNNGIYTCDGVATYAAGPNETTIVVNETVALGDADGFIKPVHLVGDSWIEIGSGFTSYDPTIDSACDNKGRGHRWEAVDIGNYTIFNNGFDLPESYRVIDFDSKPVYELREQGVHSVETIHEFNGMLILGDVEEIVPDELANVLNGADPYGRVINPNLVNRFQFRLIFSPFGEPLRWGAVVPGDISAGSRTLTLDYPVLSIKTGDEIIIQGAATLGGNLQTTVSTVSGSTLTITDVAVTTVTSAPIQSTSNLSVSPQPGFMDLQDDASAILRFATLGKSLVVLKDTTIFVGRFTGDLSNPLVFDRVYEGDDSIFWRWTLATVKGEYLVYAGKTSFFRFDLANRRPVEHTELALVRPDFFDNANVEDVDGVFASANQVTDDIWFHIKGADDIRFDYRFNTVSTSDYNYTAAATVVKPEEFQSIIASTLWFVGEKSDGELFVYGKSQSTEETFGNSKNTFLKGVRSTLSVSLSQAGTTTVTSDTPFFRSDDVGRIIKWDDDTFTTIVTFTDDQSIEVGDTATHTAVSALLFNSYITTPTLQGGYGSFKEPYHEKNFRANVTILASSTENATFTTTLETVRNPSESPTTVATLLFPNPEAENLLSLFARHNYIRDRITISDTHLDLHVVVRIFEYQLLKTSSAIRRLTS